MLKTHPRTRVSPGAFQPCLSRHALLEKQNGSPGDGDQKCTARTASWDKENTVYCECEKVQISTVGITACFKYGHPLLCKSLISSLWEGTNTWGPGSPEGPIRPLGPTSPWKRAQYTGQIIMTMDQVHYASHNLQNASYWRGDAFFNLQCVV